MHETWALTEQLCLYPIHTGILINSILHNFQQHEKNCVVGLLLCLLHWVFLVRGILTRSPLLTVLHFFFSPPPSPIPVLHFWWLEKFPAEWLWGNAFQSSFFFLYYPYLRNAKCVGPFHFLIQPLAWGIVATVFGVGTGSSRNIPGSHLYVGQVNHTQRRQWNV